MVEEKTEGQETQEKQEKQSRMWGMLCHLTALTIFLAIPFGNLIGPFVIWILKKDEYAVRLAKKLINENQDIDMESTLEKEYVGMMNCGLMGGFAERLKDFVEKHR